MTQREEDNTKGYILSLLLLLSLAWVLNGSIGWAKVMSFGKKGPKIGFILSTLQEERYQRDKKIFEETVRKLGGEVIFSSCNNNEQTQAAEVDNLLSQGIQVLVMQPVNSESAVALVKHAKTVGVPVVDYDRLIKNAPIDALVTEDSFKVGKLQAEAAVKFTHGKGNYVLLMGQAGQSMTEARTAGALSVLRQYPLVNIVVKQYHPGWSSNLAMQTTENALAQYSNNIQAVISNNSGMAHGALQALQEQKLIGKVFVAGADADITSIKDIASGKQQFEVLISIPQMAKRAAEIAMALVKKEDFTFDTWININASSGATKVRTVYVPVFPVDKAKIENRIIGTGYHTRKAIYGKSSF